MSPSQSSRYFILIRYAVLFILNLTAIFFAFNNGVYFIITIFFGFAVTSCLAAYSAWRFRVVAEMWLVKMMIFYIVILIVLDIFFYQMLMPVSAVAFLLLCLEVAIFLIHRIIKLRWLIKQTKIFNGGGDYNDC